MRSRGLGCGGEAGQIDIDKRGVQLPLKDVPTEVTPLVKAVNDSTGAPRHRL